jgi:hypothetical protein
VTASPDVPAPDRPARDPTASEHPPAARSSRAGRDLGSAIAVGLGLGAIILVPLLTVRQTFVGVLAGATAVASGTANFTNPQIAIEIADGIAAYLAQNGVARVDEIIGAVSA